MNKIVQFMALVFFPLYLFQFFKRLSLEMDKTGGGGGGKPLITSLIHKSSSSHPTPILPLVQ